MIVLRILGTKEQNFAVCKHLEKQKDMFMKNSLCRSKSSSANSSARGMALVTTLLLLIMLSALAIAFTLAVNTENRMQGTDKGNTQAYYGAEAGMEKMMIDLNGLYNTAAAPSVAQIQGLSALSTCTSPCPFPVIPGIQYSEYNFNTTPSATDPTQPKTWPSTVQAGPNAGLIADVIPITLSVTAKTNASEEVRMIRNVEVALIPVFQFGVFSDSDLDTFAGPPMEIGGRVQTNGDLYLAAGNGGDTAFLGKLRTAKEVVRDFLANGASMTTHTGIVEIPTATGGCNSPAKSACRQLSYTGPNESSWQGGVWPDTVDPFGNSFGGNLNTTPGWGGISSTYSGFLLAHEDGVKPLSLPFVQPGVSNIEILRRGQTTDPVSLTQSRLYSKAQIRVLLDDDPADLPGGAGDPNNIRLANTGTYANGVPVTVWPAVVPNQQLTTTACNSACTTFFAEGTNAAILGPGPFTADTNWVLPKSDAGGTYTENGTPVVDNGMSPNTAPYMTDNPNTPLKKRWSLIDGWLRVEVRKADGSYLPVTAEWLKLGFARGFDTPTAPLSNSVHPQAILILQQLANRKAMSNTLTNPTGGPAMIPGIVSETTGKTVGNPLTPALTALGVTDLKKDTSGKWVYAGDPTQANNNPASVTPSATVGSNAFNFYPINMYDSREGEPRENTNPNGGGTNRVAGGNYGCTVNGVMNIVEIDVGNLQKWLTGATGTNGTQVENVSQNGYILYFSDHRGMLPEAAAPKAGPPIILGAYGFEDVINPGSSQGIPNNATTPMDAGEDVEIAGDAGSGLLEVYGSANLGLGFGFNPGDLAPGSVMAAGAHRGDEVFTRLPKCDIGRANWVSGARHGVRLIDGGPGNLPLRANGDPSNIGGFTVASDNPAYVEGNYNASAAGWDNPVAPAPGYPHASAAVLADTVTLLSNSWNDLNSFASPGSVTGNYNATTGTITTPNIMGRVATATYYRLAIASGKNVDFPLPTYGTNGTPIGTNGGATNPGDLDKTGTVGGPPSDYGTDGGIHNFLRYLETWSKIDLGNVVIPSSGSFYNGSMVSLYYSQYTTGVFKCCGTVYQPPNRNYHFDLDFQNLSEVPPGTPRFQEVINVGYKQDLTYR
jgi:hypothetical protein